MNKKAATLDFDSPEYQYVSGQYHPSFVDLFELFDRDNASALESNSWELDIPYGCHKRQVFDICYSSILAKAIIVYFHAGYWQSRDKSQFRFLATELAKSGFHVAFVNYPLCPEVGVDEIINSAIKALPVVCDSIEGSNNLPLLVAGHSAGGHLAVECGLAGIEKFDDGFHGIDAVISISGVFDLKPLVETSLNKNLKLDTNSAEKFSPISRVKKNAPPAIFIVGGNETRHFIQQSRDMAETWNQNKNSSQFYSIDGKDHFTVLDTFKNPNGNIIRLLEDKIIKATADKT